MVNRKSTRKAKPVPAFDASIVPKKTGRGRPLTKKAGKPKKTTVKSKGRPKSKAATKRSTASEKVVVDNTDYEVEAIWGIQRISKHYNEVDVLIKWVGYKNPTWETLENASDSKELLKPFKKAIDRVSGKLKLPNEDETIADDDSEDEGEEKTTEYEVEDVIGVKYNAEMAQIEYLVKWKGWPYGDCTWEPLINVEDLPEYLEFFEEAADALKGANRIGIETKRTPAKKRRANDEEHGAGSDEGEEEESGDAGPSTPKRGRKSKPGPASSKKVVANGSTRRSARK